MNNYFDFFKKAIGQKVFVDVDGTILKSFEIPDDVKGNKLVWWNENLDVTDKLYFRLLYLAGLKLMGSELVVWTNRAEHHKEMTLKALGLFRYLFSDFQFHCGKKAKQYNSSMLVMDDDKRYNGDNSLIVVKA